jgi:hypothetical protein
MKYTSLDCCFAIFDSDFFILLILMTGVETDVLKLSIASPDMLP